MTTKPAAVFALLALSLAALDEVEPGGMILFRPGTYLVGEAITFAVPEVMVRGMTAHVLDNHISVPEAERVPDTRHPGGALGITGWPTLGLT